MSGAKPAKVLPARTAAAGSSNRGPNAPSTPLIATGKSRGKKAKAGAPGGAQADSSAAAGSGASASPADPVSSPSAPPAGEEENDDASGDGALDTHLARGEEEEEERGARDEENEQHYEDEEEEEEELLYDDGAQPTPMDTTARVVEMLARLEQRVRAQDQLLRAKTAPSASSAAVARRQLVVPSNLTFERAGASSTLEDWLDGMELMFDQLKLGAKDDKARLAESRLCCDRDMRHWWEGQCAQAEKDGAPIATWAGFKKELRTQFLPRGETQEAIRALIDVRQHAGESMDKYCLRATQLFMRCNGAFEDSAAMHIVLHRTRAEEWRNTVAIARRDVEAGKITTLTQLRTCLQREALAEPGRQRDSGSCNSGAQSQSKSQQHKRSTVRAAPVATKTSDGEDTEGETTSAPGGAGTTKVAAAHARGDDARRGPSSQICSRCEQKGHWAGECDKPDLRHCHNCGERGHLRWQCKKRSGGGKAEGAGSSGSSSAQSKNV
jgi:hypothetical protein